MLLLLLLLCKTLRQVTFFPGPQHQQQQQQQAVVGRKGPVIVLSDTAELGTRCTEGLEKLARVEPGWCWLTISG